MYHGRDDQDYSNESSEVPDSEASSESANLRSHTSSKDPEPSDGHTQYNRLGHK